MLAIAGTLVFRGAKKRVLQPLSLSFLYLVIAGHRSCVGRSLLDEPHVLQPALQLSGVHVRDSGGNLTPTLVRG